MLMSELKGKVLILWYHHEKKCIYASFSKGKCKASPYSLPFSEWASCFLGKILQLDIAPVKFSKSRNPSCLYSLSLGLRALRDQVLLSLGKKSHPIIIPISSPGKRYILKKLPWKLRMCLNNKMNVLLSSANWEMNFIQHCIIFFASV